MLCNNCQQDMGYKKSCPFCGYDPALDGPNAVPALAGHTIAPQPVRVELKKSTNRKANAGFVLSFFGFAIIPGILSLIFSPIGFFQAKVCRCGRGKAIAAFVIDLLWIWAWIKIISR